MSAEIIMFVPRPNPNRKTLLEEVEHKGEEFLDRAPELVVDHPHMRSMAIDILDQIFYPNWNDYDPRKGA